MTSPQARINATTLRAERAQSRHALRHLVAAICIAAAVVSLARVALITALSAPHLAAIAIAGRGM